MWIPHTTDVLVQQNTYHPGSNAKDKSAILATNRRIFAMNKLPILRAGIILLLMGFVMDLLAQPYPNPWRNVEWGTLPDGRTWGKTGYAPGEFRVLHTITIDQRGRIFVGDRSNNRLQIFDQDGNFVSQWTQFGRPIGIFFDEND